MKDYIRFALFILCLLVSSLSIGLINYSVQKIFNIDQSITLSVPYHKPSIVEKIIVASRSRGMKESDVQTFIEIAKGESRLNPRAVHLNNDGSKDYGLFQVNTKYHKVSTVCLLDIDCNINEAISIANSSGFGAWYYFRNHLRK